MRRVEWEVHCVLANIVQFNIDLDAFLFAAASILFAVFIQFCIWIRSSFIAVNALRIHSKFARNLCIKCGYDLSGLGQAPRCPECGQDYTTPPTETFKVRRFRKRHFTSGLGVLAISPLLLFASNLLIGQVYWIVPWVMGYSNARYVPFMKGDADGSAAYVLPWLLIALCPLWLTKRRPRRLWLLHTHICAVGLVLALLFATLHSRSLWMP